MELDAEIVIVGAGVAGLATARALAGGGRDVLLLEQFELGHARGSSHGATRILIFAMPSGTYSLVTSVLSAFSIW